MELSKTLAGIKQQISQGNLEEAYGQLVQLLDAYAHYAELADIARVNQADLYQLKAQTLKGTISPDDARLTTNQLADKALQLIRQLETGKLSFGEDNKPTRSKAWWYYLAAGIAVLALAIILWQVLGGKKKEDDCPAFSDTAELKVMILPFKQTGKSKEVEPEFDIMDGLNDLIDSTPGLRVRAIADVYESYDIDKDYPNSAQAVEIARHCNAKMLVWGKVKQSNDKNYTVDVRYRLLDAGGVRYAGDTTINRLLTVTEEASWTNDVEAITRLLYLVLANQMQVRIAANMLAGLQPPVALSKTAGIDSLPPVDTSTSLVLADYYIGANKEDQAIAEYDKVLSYDPDNSVALTKRGVLLMKKQDYSGAARDLEAVSVNESQAAPALRVARIEAFIKSGQTEKAKVEVESARSEGSLDEAKLQEKSSEVRDSTLALQKRRDRLERQAAQRPNDVNIHVSAAKANLSLGEPDKALKLANEVLEDNPKNVRAVEIATEAHLQKGDTASAIKVIQSAEKAGLNLKKSKLEPVRQRILPEKQQ